MQFFFSWKKKVWAAFLEEEKPKMIFKRGTCVARFYSGEKVVTEISEDCSSKNVQKRAE